MQSSLADGDWHSLAVVVDGSVATFYLDASRINSRCVPCKAYAFQHGLLRLNCRSLRCIMLYCFTGRWKSLLSEMERES